MTIIVNGVVTNLTGTPSELTDGATLAEIASTSVALQSAVNTVSHALSALIDRVSANSGTGGGGSVTSAELQAVSAAAASGITTASNAISVETANRISAVDVVSNAVSALSQTNSANHVSINGRIDTVSNAVSVVSQALSALSQTNSAAHVSIDGRVTSVANAVSVVSNALSALSQTNSVDHAALSNRITSVAGLAGGGSVTSTELSAAVAGQSTRTDSVANAVSVLSNANSAAHVSIDGRVTSVANAVSVLSQALSVLSQTNSAAHVSIDGRVTSVANAVSVVSQALSALSQTNSVDHAALSNRITSVAGLAGGGSVTSNELSAAIAGQSARTDSVFSVLSVLINRVSANSGTGGAGSVTSVEVKDIASALSVRIDTVSAAAAAAGGPQIRKVVNVQSTNGSALVDISGLVLTVAANETWEIQGMIALSTSATTVGLRMGYSVPPLSTPRFGYFCRLSGGQSAGIAGGAGQLQVSGASINMSITGAGPAGGVYVITSKHVMNVASAGTVRLMYAGIASTTASPIHIMPGSYLKGIKI